MRGTSTPWNMRAAGSANVGRDLGQTTHPATSNDSSISRDRHTIGRHRRLFLQTQTPSSPQRRQPDVTVGILQPSRHRPIVAGPAPSNIFTTNQNVGTLPNPRNQTPNNPIDLGNFQTFQGQGQGIASHLVNERSLPGGNQQ